MRLPTRVCIMVAGVLGLAVLAGCGGDDKSTGGGAGIKGVEVALAAKTCWTAATLGADPQEILDLADEFKVSYFDAAAALEGRPAFDLTEACAGDHHVEVYKVVPVAQITPVASSYATLLQSSQPAYRALSAAVDKACMPQTLATTAKKAKLAGVIAEPAFPAGITLGWAPPSPEQWKKGQRVYACTLTAEKPVRFSYGSVFRKSFPTSLRTCILTSKLVFVDCAGKHDREKIAVLQMRSPVLAGKFPGKKAIKLGPDGRFVDVPAATLAELDKACTSYLRAISTTKKLTGLAELDPDHWPSADGTYPVACEADVAVGAKALVTQGSVYNR